MKKIFMLCMALAISAFAYNVIIAAENPTSTEMKMKQEKALPTGEELFLQNCAVCHRGGGNIINPEKTLHKEDRDEFGIKTPEDIIKLMRNPGPGMRTFDIHTVPDKEAKRIAEYIFKTF
jgi:cytochrome c6